MFNDMSAPTAKLKLVRRANEILKNSLKKCLICPRKCGVDRTAGELGYCRAGDKPVVYSYLAHHGEEPPLSGNRGSGTIFFSHCNMKCAYCQNYYFSQKGEGKETSIESLARIMLSLQEGGCHNINLVTPTHFVPQILSALEIAFDEGLNIPIVYNTSGYDLPETIRLLRGIVDIYLPDMRYSSNEMAIRYSGAPNYVEYNRESIKEMHAQVGDLIMGKDDIAVKGMIIRLLVLPKGISGTPDSLRFIENNLGKSMYLSIMSQYHPTHKAGEFKELCARITKDEYQNVVDEAKKLGLNNGWIQEAPDFDPKFLGTNIKQRNCGT